MRYSKPRKLRTKRGQLKAEQNAWCLVHRIPMQKHGKNFVCAGHWSTRVAITTKPVAQRPKKAHKVTFAEHSAASASKRHLYSRADYPHCLRCHLRMVRITRDTGCGLGYRCVNCNNTVMARYASKQSWRRRVPTVLRSDYERLLRNINRRVPYSLPEEMRDDIKAEMAVAVLQALHQVTSNVQGFITRYKKQYPQRAPLDENWAG
jgi:hypothetical protein